MITAKEAYSLLKNKFKASEPSKCVEYNDIYVFVLEPTANFLKGKMLDNLLSVNKHTGDIRTFKPFDIPIEEYKNSKEINDFK